VAPDGVHAVGLRDRPWRFQAEWQSLGSNAQTGIKVFALVAATAIAYHYSLASLVQTLGSDTPLAYLALVPFLAAGVAWLNRTPRVPETPIHDRELDVIVGCVFVGLAVVVETVLPGRLGLMFWIERLDLLSLPCFVVGATIVVFGIRVAWRQRFALAYLLLGWPWLYTSELRAPLADVTSLTVWAIGGVLRGLGLARSVGDSPGVFAVNHGGHSVLVSVVTACSGVDSMVGFLLIGLALGAVTSGPLVKKALWLATGVVLFWGINLLRLLLICWVARIAGPGVALGGLHPVAGLVLFCAGVGLMAALTIPMGLTRAVGTTESAAARPTPGPGRAPLAGFSILLAASVVLCVCDTDLQVFDPVATVTGQPRLGSFLADPATPEGWAVRFDTEYDMNKPLFGQDSRWFRYIYLDRAPFAHLLTSTLPVTADIIDADGLGGFSQFGITDCYSFHGYQLRGVTDVGLGDGIQGQTLSYSGGPLGREVWSIVYWIVPVETGSGTRFERVVLSLQTSPVGRVALASPGGLHGGVAADRAFLVAFARQLISGQRHQPDTAVLVDTIDPRQAAPARADTDAGPSPTNVGFWLDYALRHRLGGSR